MELLVIRHGQSEGDLLEVHEGRADFSLTEVGEGQARKMAAYVAEHFPPDLILSSPLKRASRTSHILQEEIGCDLQFHADLMEYNNGVLAGLPKKETAITHPLPKGGRPVHIPIPDGESELELRYRAEWMLHHILFEFQDVRRVAIVSHGGLISNLIKAFLHQPNGKFAFSTGDTGIHLLEQREDTRFVRFLNKQDHLLL
ncbi:histidine phosphatase family protein [Sporosarcina sp. Te-1]|uniref:histidine phosphatase family protein n=1 Tax=Sporosarcina sp. Te-1 TaxID=2818390 RepID=UPI001A9F1C7B|nr:histidine phosphatase family protein [Sporosarcina sp. Te-1]QTD43222.1 histidine phosphatase family protein [Sporosarcina sp. Te-1]